jgi:tetratricopeptide (TPR) repeat protein
VSRLPKVQSETTPPTDSRAKRVLLALLGTAVLCGATAFIYVRTLDAPFIFDDVALVEINESVRRLFPLLGNPGEQTPLRPSPNTPTSGRPLVNLSFAINYHFGQFDPTGYRAVNVILHACCALLIWSIVRRTLRLEYFASRFDRVAGLLSFAVALLWAVHPLGTETVIYVTQRTELMMAFFYLATLYFCLRYWAAERHWSRCLFLILATACSALGMLSKEMMASAPAIMLLYDRTFISRSFASALRRHWPLYVCLAVTWTPLVALNWHAPSTPLAGFGMGIDARSYWYTQCQVLFTYLRLAVWPWPQLIYYDVPLLHDLNTAWPWVLAVCIGALVTIWLLWRRPAIGFVPVLVVAVLSPTLVVPCVGEVAAERRMYLPLAALAALAVIGFYLVAGYVIQRFMSARNASRATLLVTALAVCLASGTFLVASVKRAELYRDELNLWQDALRYEPNAPLVHINLGSFLAKHELTDAAIQHFRRALELDPESYEAHYNLGRALEDQMRPREAIDHYREALRLEPTHVASLTNFARMLDYLGKPEEALEKYREAVRLSPRYGLAHHNLGSALLLQGHYAEAIAELELSLPFQQAVETYTNLATAYARDGRPQEAIAAAQQGLELAEAQGKTDLAESIRAALEQFKAANPPTTAPGPSP